MIDWLINSLIRSIRIHVEFRNRATLRVRRARGRANWRRRRLQVESNERRIFLQPIERIDYGGIHQIVHVAVIHSLLSLSIEGSDRSAQKMFDPDAESASDIEENAKLMAEDEQSRLLSHSVCLLAADVIYKELSFSFIMSIFGLAVLYALNNQLAFVLFLWVDPASITLFKSWSTGLSALILWQIFARPIGRLQWAAIVLQVVGLFIVQYDPCKGAASSLSTAYLLMILLCQSPRFALYGTNKS